MRRNAESINTDELCSYGCGTVAKFKNGSGKFMCDTSANKCPVNRAKNSKGASNAYASGKKLSSKVQYANLPQETKDRMAWSRGLRTADFSYNGKGSHKAVLIQERGHVCERCGLTEWLGDPIPLELEHSDGDNKNNQKENLLLLCPNCHAKTKFYRGRNIPNQGKLKVNDDKIIEEINKGLNNRQVLINVGLTPKGANYDRVNRLRQTLLMNTLGPLSVVER